MEPRAVTRCERLVERCWVFRETPRRRRGGRGRTVVVPAEDLSFVDGWAVGKTEKTPKLIDEDARPTLEDERVMTVKPSQVTIGRKEAQNRSKSSPAVCGEGALSFDVDE